MQTNLNEMYKEITERYYNRLLNTYTKRLAKANDKAYTHEEFSNYCGALLVFRYEDSPRTRIVEHFEHDYKIGKDLVQSLLQLRKTYRTVPEDQNTVDFYAIDELGNTVENEQPEGSKNCTIDLFKCTDSDLIQMYAEFSAYKRFRDFLDMEKTKYIDSDVDVEPDIPDVPNVEAKSEFTTARQVLAIHYLLKYAKVNDVDKTEIARFIQFLTGKNSSNVYKRVQNPFKVNDKALAEDLRYVRAYFERLKLLEVVKMINNEIDSV